MDGAASSMAAVVAGGLAVLGLADGRRLAGRGCARRCAGRASGFLPHNLLARRRGSSSATAGACRSASRSRALAMIGVGGRPPPVAVAGDGPAVVGIPALDTTLVIISRRGAASRSSPAGATTSRTARSAACARRVPWRSLLGGAQAVVSALALVAIAPAPVRCCSRSSPTCGRGAWRSRRSTRGCGSAPAAGRDRRRASRCGRRRRQAGASAAVLLAGIGALAGLSPFFFAATTPPGRGRPSVSSCWRSAAAIAVARPVARRGRSALALAGLGGLGALCARVGSAGRRRPSRRS